MRQLFERLDYVSRRGNKNTKKFQDVGTRMFFRLVTKTILEPWFFESCCSCCIQIKPFSLPNGSSGAPSVRPDHLEIRIMWSQAV